MIIDTNLRLSNAQAITATADSTDMVNMGLALRDVGTGRTLSLVVVITTAMTNTGTVEVKLQGDSTSTMTPDKARSLFVIPAASAVGDTFIAHLHPRGDVEQYQYVNISYTVSGTVSAGNATAFFTQDPQAWVAKAKNYTIS